MSRVLSLDRPHGGQKACVVLRAIGAGMDAAMTVWAKADDKAGIVRSAVTDPANVVGFKVRFAVSSHERGRQIAAFAIIAGARQNIVSHVSATLEDCPRNQHGSCCSRSGQRLGLQFRKGVAILLRGGIYQFDNAPEWQQFKYDRLSIGPVGVWRALIVKRGAHHLIFEAKSCARFLEKQEIFAVLGVVTDGGIPADPGHVPLLTFAKIFEHAVVTQTVVVPVPLARFAGNNENDVVRTGRNNSALSLPVKPGVNIGSPIVDTAAFESPSHRSPQTIQHRYQAVPALGSLAVLSMHRRVVLIRVWNWIGQRRCSRLGGRNVRARRLWQGASVVPGRLA